MPVKFPSLLVIERVGTKPNENQPLALRRVEHYPGVLAARSPVHACHGVGQRGGLSY